MGGLAVALTLAVAAGCSWFDTDSGLLLRSTLPINGMRVGGHYLIDPTGASETNAIDLKGINGLSPMSLTTTRFEKGAGSTTQTVLVTGKDGEKIEALSMNKRDLNFGLTDILAAQVATYEQRDHLGHRACGAKVRLTWQPIIAQQILKDKNRRHWDAIYYYGVPCAPADGTTVAELDLAHAKFLGLVINQQWAPRITLGKPSARDGNKSFINRGHSVTVVDGKPAQFVGGWWQTNAGILNASNQVIGMVKELDQHEWMGFGPQYSDSNLVYSAGDADVYLSWSRFFLDRQVDYLVNFRAAPNLPWQRVLIHPVYNKEWNDVSQNWEALTGDSRPKIDDLVDKDSGLPKNLDDPDSDNRKALKEIETAGCQNCPNADLEQVQFINPDTGRPLYAATLRAYLGSESTLVMFGQVPASPSTLLKQSDQTADKTRECPIRRDDKGEKVDEQYDEDDCAKFLREGALWDMITQDPSKTGSDVVGQFQVRDNSKYASQCSGSGDTQTCTTVATSRRMDASYLFSDVGAKMHRAWTVLQGMGETGMRTFGFSYASGAYDGSGLDYAMAQPEVLTAYNGDLTDKAKPYNPELVFALDARALQLPTTLGEMGKILYGSPN